MRTPHITLLALLGALAAPATAAAHHGPTTFEQTFRAESRLCSAVAAGNAPAPLKGHEAEVTAACTALHSAYDAAVAAAPTTATGNTALKDAVAKVQTACAGDSVDPEACAHALGDAYKALRSGGDGDHSAKRAYRQAIEQARHTFRRAVYALVGPGLHKHDGDAPHGDEPAGDAPAAHAPTDD